MLSQIKKRQRGTGESAVIADESVSEDSKNKLTIDAKALVDKCQKSPDDPDCVTVCPPNCLEIQGIIIDGDIKTDSSLGEFLDKIKASESAKKVTCTSDNGITKTCEHGCIAGKDFVQCIKVEDPKPPQTIDPFN